MFSSLKVREFRIFWVSMFISLVGTWIQSTAQSWLVFKLTHSAFLLGVVGFLSYLPLSLFSLIGGAFADRVVKRNFLIITQISFMTLAFILAFLIQHNYVQVWHIILLAFLSGVVMTFDAPTRQSMVVELVGKQHLLNAIALNSAAFNSARMIGPALAGILIATTSMAGCFYINAFSYLPVIFALILIKPAKSLANGKNGTIFQDTKEALKLVKNNPFFSSLLSLVGIVSVFAVSYVMLMPVFAQDVLNSGAYGLAVLMSASGIGALAGSLSLARIKQSEPRLRIFKVSIIIFFVSVMLFSLSKFLWLSALFLALAGYGGSSSMSMANTLLQINVSDEYRGRLMGVFIMMFSGLMPFGNLASGILTHFFGVQPVVFFGAILSFCFCIPFAKKMFNSVPQRLV